jgi:hypothetical protein
VAANEDDPDVGLFGRDPFEPGPELAAADGVGHAFREALPAAHIGREEYLVDAVGLGILRVGGIALGLKAAVAGQEDRHLIALADLVGQAAKLPRDVRPDGSPIRGALRLAEGDNTGGRELVAFL